MSTQGILGVDAVKDRHAVCYPPLTVKFTNTAIASDTYQATTHLNKLHELRSPVDLLIERGTGASVTVTTGTFVPKGEPFPFTPLAGVESLGYKPLTGSFSATDIATICIREA
jgi:hypothetical protein